MGLDMYAFAVPKKNVINDFSVKKTNDRPIEIMYWRKHPYLHGWFKNLYLSKGGQDLNFDLVPVRVDENDLDKLEDDIKYRRLPHTTGFFFGDYAPDDESDAMDLKFIEEAREYIKDGYAIYYKAWW